MKTFITICSLIGFSLMAVAQTGTFEEAPAPEEDEITDYGHLYPKSTPEEFALAAEATRLGCNEFRRKALRFAPSSAKTEDPEATCQCLIRNLSPAKDIHEMRVLNAMFRGHDAPPSVFARVEELADVFDERPDYRDHAHRVMEQCRLDANYSSEADADSESNELVMGADGPDADVLRSTAADKEKK